MVSSFILTVVPDEQTGLNTENAENVKLVADESKKNLDWPWKRARKVAVMISFRGKDYFGMQRYIFKKVITVIWERS